MSKTPSSSETSIINQNSQGAFNYAAAAKRSSLISDQRGHNTTRSPSQPSTPTSRANANGIATKAAGGTAAGAQEHMSSPPIAQQQSAYSTKKTSSYKSGASNTGSRSSRSISVQMPQPPPVDNAQIQFGSVNQSTPVQTSAFKATDTALKVSGSALKFGSVHISDTSSSNLNEIRSGTYHTPITATTIATAATTAATSPGNTLHQKQQRNNDNSSPHSANHSSVDNQKARTLTQSYAPPNPNPVFESQPQQFQSNHPNRTFRTYQNRHPQPPNSQSPQTSNFLPAHQKKSPHMGTSPSPSMAPQPISVIHGWSSSNATHPQPYMYTQNYDNQQPHYYTPLTMAYGAPPYVQHSRGSKALPIIDPNTRAEIKTDSRVSTTIPAKDTVKHDERKSPDTSNTFSPAHTPTPAHTAGHIAGHAAAGTSTIAPVNAIPVDKAILARQKREREEAEQQAREEAERKLKEEQDRLDALRKAKEEEERKEREEKERLEAEKRAKEEAERKEREELERLAAEKRAKEEAERKKREEMERLEAERKIKEEEDRKRLEEEERLAAEKKEAEPKEAAELREREEQKAKEDQKASIMPRRLNLETIVPEAHQPYARTPKTPAGAMRTIDDPSTVHYPPDVKAPFGTKDPNSGKIQYDPAFLMQFAPLCLETSEDLSAFQHFDYDQDDRNSRMANRRQGSERSRTPRTPVGGEINMFRHGSKDSRMEMGKFSGGRPLSHRGSSGGPGLPQPSGALSPGGMQREGSHGARTRSNRGGKSRQGSTHGASKDQEKPPQPGAPTIPPEQVTPLEKSENRWVPLALRRQREAEVTESGVMSDEFITRKVKALLNKLTLEKFDSISDQIWDFAKQSEKEENGRALRLVIDLTFEKACDEPAFAMMWAQLCRKMYDSVTDDIRDVNSFDKDGNIVSGINLFRKLLLNRCQADFERGWKVKLPQVDESNTELLSDEYYAAVKAKRQGLGLVVFIGELFKRHMLIDKIMMECLVRLADDPKNAEDEETETMCKLLTTVGEVLDNPRSKRWLDKYFLRMKEVMESPNISSRVKFMIMDVFDLRKNKWVSRRGKQPAPATLAEIHEQAQKSKTEEKEIIKRTSSSRGGLPPNMARTGSHRGGGRDMQREGSNNIGNPSSNVDGWNTVVSGAGSGASSPSRVNELANFGKTDRTKARTNILSPSNSPFASLNRVASKCRPGVDFLEKYTNSSSVAHLEAMTMPIGLKMTICPMEAIAFILIDMFIHDFHVVSL
ncbi:hypothetical protein BX666DRAFT_2032861 [Dichotomocladium elegans]|nr:hypothetical protein BX666DRAFT_2032861 [Dichotomocladium elegans]